MDFGLGRWRRLVKNDAQRPRCQLSAALTVAVAATDDDGDFKLVVVKDRQMQNSTWRPVPGRDLAGDAVE